MYLNVILRSLEVDMSGWISVDVEKPKKDQLCITSFLPTQSRTFALKRHYEVGYGLQSFGSRVADMWMPLPEPPKE